MARNPFKGVQVPGSVSGELNARAETSKLLKWTAKRVPWIHVMSMSSACGGDYKELGSSRVALSLFGASPTKALYEEGTRLPLPNITGVDVGALGNLGSTRKATIKLKAYTDEQLVELQKCYFIPGMDVRCQFGWSESCTGEAPPPVYKSPNARAIAICQIHKNAAGSSCYDGFQGIVSNFKYNLQNDNTWDCEIELISPADPFAESTVSNSTCGCARKSTTKDAEGNEKEGTAKNGQLYAMLLDIFTDPANGATWKSKLQSNPYAGSSDLKATIGYTSRFYFGKGRTEVGGDDSSWYEGWFGGDDYNTTEQYISYGMLEAAINAYTIPNAEGLPYGRVDSSGIVLPIPTTLLATDPRVCIVGGGKTFPGFGGGGYSMAETTQLSAGSIKPALSGDGVELCNVEVNVVFLMLQLKKVLDGDKLMGTFVRAVVEEINRTCGNPWNIEVIANNDNVGACENSPMTGAVISVVDAKNFEKGSVYLVPAKAGKSAVRSIGLDLKMTGGMKTQALYGPGSQQQGSGNASSGGDATGCEGKAIEPFYVGGSVKNNAIPTAKKDQKTKCDCDSIPTPKAEPAPSLNELGAAATSYVSDETCGALLTKLIETIHEQPKPHCAGTPLPFDFSFEVDGIGGFRWGQVVSCDRIPEAIRSKMQWQITKVDHSITANDWVTKVGTIARPSS